MIKIILAAAILAVAYDLYGRPAVQESSGYDGYEPTPDYPDYPEEPDQETNFFEDTIVTLTPSTYQTGNFDGDTAARNIAAFLATIAYAEGTAGARGYQTMFGYRYFDSYADHPRQYFDYTDNAGKKLKTSAAGRYQIIVKTWDSLRKRLGLQDFSPASQDAAAVELIRERGALNDVRAGRIAQAIQKCAPVWASLPGAGANQPERKLSALMNAFASAGGQAFA